MTPGSKSARVSQKFSIDSTCFHKRRCWRDVILSLTRGGALSMAASGVAWRRGGAGSRVGGRRGRGRVGGAFLEAAGHRLAENDLGLPDELGFHVCEHAV